jgi:hypothetical protein
MKFIYVMIKSNDWEDIVIYLSEQEAIDSSLTYPNSRIEIFGVSNESNGYSPTYNYYKGGKLYKYSDK